MHDADDRPSGHIRNIRCICNDKRDMTRSIDHTIAGQCCDGAVLSDGTFRDGTQAGYFRRVLTEQRSALDARIDTECRVLATRARAHNTFGVKALQRRIREMQKRRNELDRLIAALSPTN